MAERERQVREELTAEVGVMKDNFERELDELRSTLDEEHNNELKKYGKSPSLVCCENEKCALFRLKTQCDAELEQKLKEVTEKYEKELELTVTRDRCLFFFIALEFFFARSSITSFLLLQDVSLLCF